LETTSEDLNQSTARFQELGYLVVPDFLSRRNAADLYSRFDSLDMITWEPGMEKTANERTLLYDHQFADVVIGTPFMDLLRQTIGDDYQLLAYQALEIGPKSGAAREWHIDFHVLNPLILTVRVAIYLTDMTEEMGPLYVIPGSHRWGREPSAQERESELEGEIRVTVPAGTAVAFAGQLWHSASRNNSDRPRRALFPYCGHYWMKRLDEYYRVPLPTSISGTNDQPMKQLFGVELSITSAHGASYRRGNKALE